MKARVLKSRAYRRFRELSATDASQLAELAVALPLLVLVMLGITDFGAAFNLKHKLDMAVQTAARVAASQTMVDVTESAPNSTEAVRQAFVGYLLSVKVADCGLTAAAPTKTVLSWQYAASAGCAGTATLTINRGDTFQTAGTPLVEATHVRISYPYRWRLNRAVQLLLPGASFTGPSQIATEAVAQNLN